jgi:hypothetical protein
MDVVMADSSTSDLLKEDLSNVYKKWQPDIQHLELLKGDVEDRYVPNLIYCFINFDVFFMPNVTC